MNLKAAVKKEHSTLFLSFLIPFAGMLLVMLVSGYKPFGKYSMLYSDMYHQYYPFFLSFRRALLSGDSLLYNWSIGMGLDYLGLLAYYLASPLNLLSVLVPEGWLLSYFSMLVPLKLGFAGLFFGIFLKKIFRTDDRSVCVFASLYALCAWALGFQWNVMWLDTFALLPLTVLGTVLLLREGKFLLYTLSLFFAVFANYYVGFFVCIFVALVFLCYEICRFPGWKRLASDFLRIAFFSLLAIGMTAILTLPAFAALQTTQSSVNAFPSGFRLNIASENTLKGLLDGMRQVAGNMGGGLKPNFKEGLPNLYCGVGSIFLAFLYLLSSRVRLRDRLCALGLLLFFVFSFLLRQLDYIWHGFHFPNMIPYRFSFIFSFVLLYMAFAAWVRRKEWQLWQVIASLAATICVLCCSNSLTGKVDWKLFDYTFSVPVYLLYNLPLLAGFAAAFLRCVVEERPAPEESEVPVPRRLWAARFFLLVAVVELSANLLAFGLYFPGTNVSNYPKGTEEAASMFRYIKERERYNPFYRTETTHSQTLNDDALNNYNGISAFTSSANVRVTEFMRALGYGAKNTYNRYCFEESSPVANLFLNLKYMIERDGRDRSSTWFTDVHHYGNIHLLQNNAYLPLGFLAEESLAELDFSQEKDPFDFQNDLFRAATGVGEQVFSRLGADALQVVPNGVNVTDTTSGGTSTYSDAVSGSDVTYVFRADRAGFACIYLNCPKRNEFVVSVNGVELYRENISLPQTLAVSDVAPGDEISVRVLTKAEESSTMTVRCCLMREDVFREGYEVLSQSTLGVTYFSNTRVDGIIQCNRDGLLYTSVPQNGNWSVLVDGKEAEITLVGDCMISLPLTQGDHNISLRYHNAAFSLGWKIALVCFGVFGALYLLVYQPDLHRLGLPKPRRGKFEQ